MDGPNEPSDDLRVRLTWPGSADTGTGAPPRPPDPPADYQTYEAADLTDTELPDAGAGDPPGGSIPSVTSQQLILASRSDSLQAALASIALRIDALTSTTSTFRNLVSDRLTDYAEQVGRLASGAANEIDEYRHLHERSLDQIRRSVGDADDHLRKLTRSVGDLEAKVMALVAAVRDNGDAIDHLLSERDQVSDTVARHLDRVGRQVQGGLDQGLDELTAATTRLEEGLAELNEAQTGPAVERLSELSAQLEESLVALADDRQQGMDAVGRLEQVGAGVTVAHEKGLAKLASRLEARLDQIAAGLRSVANDDLPAILTRLDARLRELSTEMVTGRDRETAKALAELSAQVDGLTKLVIEEHTVRDQQEARSSRLARAAPPADLSEIHRRLDQLAETLEQHGPPDLSDLHLHLDELARTVARGRTEAGSEVAPISDGQELLDRFDQLGQQLGDQIEALRRRIALRARPATQELDQPAIAAIAEAVIARLSATEPPARPPAPVPSPPVEVDQSRPVVSGEQRRRGPRGAR